MSDAPDPPLIAALKQAITGTGLSLSELGRRTGVSHQQLSKFMLGKTLTLVTAAKLFDRLGLTAVVPERSPVLDAEPAPPKPRRPRATDAG